MIAFLVLYIHLVIEVPIGAYNHPWKGKPSDWPGSDESYYCVMLDSAVSCGLGYFKPGWIGGER